MHLCGIPCKQGVVGYPDYGIFYGICHKSAY